MLAASAFYLVLNDDFRWELTGHSQEMIGACVHWMLPFFTVLRQRECPKVKQFDKVILLYAVYVIPTMLTFGIYITGS